MSEIRYTQTAHLMDGHSSGITAVVFNPDGSLLATAGLDGTVCVWDTKTWSLSDVYNSKTKVTLLAWFNNEALVCGLADGIISSMIKGEEFTHVRGLWGHLYPVEHLAVSGELVASGAQQELSIWYWNIDPSMSCLFRSLPGPGTPKRQNKLRKRHEGKTRGGERTDGRKDTEDSTQPGPETGHEGKGTSEVLITGIYWTPACLVVAYLNHGIKDSWQSIRSIDSNAPIITSSLSPNGGLLAAYNLGVGFQIYDLNAGEIIRTFKQKDDGEHTRAVQVSFIHGGTAIVGGSTNGRLMLWFVESERKLPSLAIPNDETVLALSGHYDGENDTFIIAAGIMNEDGPCPIIVWTAGGSVKAKRSAEASDRAKDKKLARCCTSSLLSLRLLGGIALFLGLLVLMSVVVYLVCMAEWLDGELEDIFGDDQFA
ncbi:WD40-repeat-containing domain protein [Earliella scabrosa]|nr:WD40-repeat-containing domain protein [Earliella scabrosa]